MKPCAQYRKLITMLALGELDDKYKQTRELRAHLDGCEDCQRYYKEISKVTEQLTAPATVTDIQASSAFHRRLVSRLKTEQSAGIGNILAWFQAGFENWRTAWALTGAVAVLALVLGIVMSGTHIQKPEPVVAKVAPAQTFSSDLPPTIANYQMVANRSLEKLDELLTRQSLQTPPPAPIYTASMLSLEDQN